MQTLLEGGSFFEGPRWHEGRWWVSDFYRHVVQTVDGDGRAEEVLEVEGQPSGLGWMPDGSLLVVSMRDRRGPGAGALGGGGGDAPHPPASGRDGHTPRGRRAAP